MQDININDKNKFQISLDILNFGNLLNSNWGVVEAPNFDQIMGVSVDDTSTPTYTFDPSRNTTFGAVTAEISRWRMQIGVRYIFN